MKRIESAYLLVCTAICLACGGATAVCADGGADPPVEVQIEILSERYEPVLFDHELHDGYASCVECHHHTTADPPSDPNCLPCHREGAELAEVGCSDCHLVDRYAARDDGDDMPAYHNDTPGLIGAYHLNCISCHRAIDGPVGCEDCHTRKK